MILQDEQHFQNLCQHIYRHMGLDCKQYKVSYLKRRLAVRMRATKRKTYAEYIRLLDAEPQEYELLLDRLTINVSNFFRDPSVFQQIQTLLLPKWRAYHNLHVWSAGCANGEEPYSLAILLKEGLPLHCPWDILATDIDPAVLQKATVGAYKNEALKNLPLNLKLRYFEPEGEGWKIKPGLQKKILFQIHDLTGSMPKDSFDLIVCRNVLIYFVSELQDKLFRGFYDCLRPGGFLILGKTETLLGEVRQCYEIIDARERIYKKRMLPAGPTKCGDEAG